MKMLEEKITRATCGIESNVEFKVATNSKMMKLLSDNLYSDKATSVIRELSCNCLDSHIASGYPNKPFHVHLACSANPQFTIRDYGTGLSMEDMENLYCTYGASDKSDSNSLIGAMGLGSKSPFCYTESFTATSYFNGQKFVYICGKNSKGIPTLSRMLVADTDEPNGLEISFVVKSNDYHKFYESARKVYKYFPVLPVVSGYVTDLKITHETPTLQGTGWKMFGDSDGSCAVMGYVKYPIEIRHFSKFDTGQSSWYRRTYDKDTREVDLLSLGLELHFTIGSLEVDIGREGLSYNPETIKAIKDHLKVVGDELDAILSAQFAQCKTLWESRCFYKEIEHKNHTLAKLSKVFKNSFNGQDITKNIDLRNSDNFRASRVFDGATQHNRKYGLTVRPHKTTKFYLNDVRQGAIAIAERDSKATCSEIWVFTFKGTDAEQKAERAKLVALLGIEDAQLIPVSTLPAMGKVVRTANKVKQFTYKYPNWSSSSSDVSNYWNHEDVDLNAGGYYVTLSGNVVENPLDVTMSGTSFYYFIKAALELKLITKTTRICGLRPSQVKKLDPADGWINFFDYIKQELNSYVLKHSDIDGMEEFQILNRMNTDVPDNLVMTFNKFDSTKVLGRFLNEYVRVKSLKSKFSEIINHLTTVANNVKYTLPVKKTIYDCEKNWESVLSHYPVLKMCSGYDLSEYRHRDTVCEYINLVDSVK